MLRFVVISNSLLVSPIVWPASPLAKTIVSPDAAPARAARTGPSPQSALLRTVKVLGKFRSSSASTRGNSLRRLADDVVNRFVLAAESRRPPLNELTSERNHMACDSQGGRSAN